MSEVYKTQSLNHHIYQNEENHGHYEESKMKNIDDFGSEQSDDTQNFISKVYQSILENMPLQEQMKKINKISQPILNICHDLADDKFNDIKGRGQELINTTKEKLTSWLYNGNIYSHFVGLWILQNPIHSEQISTKESFLESLRNFDISKQSIDHEEVMHIATRFYEILSIQWSKLKEPTAEDIKHILIHSVAITIGKGLQKTDDLYAGNLVHAFKNMVEKKRELMSNESFIQVVKRLTGDLWTDDAAFKKATHDFYIFAKRYTLIDLPIVMNPKSVSKALVGYTKDMSKNYTVIILNLINRYLDTLIEFLGIEVSEEEELSSSFGNKINLVLRKLHLISTKLYSRSISITTNNKLFITIDDYINFKQRFDDISFVTISTINIFKSNVYEPAQKFALTSCDRLYTDYQVKIYQPAATFITNQFDIIAIKTFNIDIKVLQERLPSIKETYEYLREATFIIKDSMLEIKFEKESLIKYRHQIMEQVGALYVELKNMDLEKTKEFISNIYNDALKKLKERRNQREIRSSLIKNKTL